MSDAEQRTREWQFARHGVITASKFRLVCAKKSSQSYAGIFQDLFRAWVGAPAFENEDTPPWYQHGIAHEDEARRTYEFAQDVEVKLTGVIFHPDYDWIGASPDGLVGDAGGIEIKCRRDKATFDKVLEKGDWKYTHRFQVQGCMWVCQREWWDMVDYCPEGSLLRVQRVERDPAVIDYIEDRCIQLKNEVMEEIERLYGK